MQESYSHTDTDTQSLHLCAFLREIRRPARSRPAEAVRLFIRRIELGKIAEAIAMLPENILKAVDPARLESILFENTSELRSRGGIARLEVVQERSSDRTAEVDVSMSYSDGSTDVERIVLIKEKREWKVDMTR